MLLPLARLPSLDLIRGFVAVGRRMSITLAADDLCVTQSAVSRQVRTLEEMLGVKLLVRGHRSIAFTTEGEQLFLGANRAVQQLQEGIADISKQRVNRRSVTVTASIGVAGLWLLPRLGRLQRRHPGIDVRIAANNRVLDLESEGIDVAIRYCPNSAAPAGAERLFGETIAPVCHPSLGLRAIDSPETLADQVLLEFDGPRRPWLRWNHWLKTSGRGRVRPRAMLRFNQYDQVIHAAVGGQGIALGRLELIGELLADGRLTRLSVPHSRQTSEYGYWLLLGNTHPRKEVLSVVEWIQSEAAGSHALSSCEESADLV